MKKNLTTAALVSILASTLLIPPAHADPGELNSDIPVTVPALHSWAPAAGDFTLTTNSRIVTFGSTTPEVATMLAQDLETITGFPVQTIAETDPVAGDIVLDGSQHALDLPEEGYRIDVSATLTLSAPERVGILHGSQTILQWLNQSDHVQGGTACDRPRYTERGLMLDLGRRFYPVDWVKDRIREMAYLKMNSLHLHLSDVQGFRLESSTHPEIVSAQHYSKDDMRSIISFAAKYGINIIPEIGFPSHMNAILQSHPELILKSQGPNTVQSALTNQILGVSTWLIDLSNPESYTLMGDILNEFLPLFPGNIWHMGGDEYVSDYTSYPQLAEYARENYGPDAQPEAVYTGLVNWVNGIVNGYGKTLRMWNDALKPEVHSSVDTNIDIEYWSSALFGLIPWAGPAYTPQALVDQGHRVLNSSFTGSYFVTGGPASTLNVSPEMMYSLWNPEVFVNGQSLSPETRHANLGSELHIWSDDPTKMTDEEIAQSILERMRIMSHHLWSEPSSLPYGEFLSQTESVGTIPRILG